MSFGQGGKSRVEPAPGWMKMTGEKERGDVTGGRLVARGKGWEQRGQ